jgi:glyoxylase-like metal-dependent hydrolase (beta-lactamase superfamily II)
LKNFSINSGNFKLDGGAMFGVVPKSIWNKLNPADENNLCNWAMRCLLVQEYDRLILIDTGLGDKQDEKFFSHYHLNGSDTLDGNLAAHGFSRSDVTDVFLTHLHFDHCGGCIVREGEHLVPAFPNALYWSNERHWQWAIQPNSREKASFLKENILPIAESGRLRFIEPGQIVNGLEVSGSPFGGNFSVITVNGHTKAMMLPKLNWNGRTIVFAADLIPAVAHLPLPYVMAYDMYPMTTLDEKEAFLQEAVANDYILFLEHDLNTECCTVQQTEKGIRVKNTFKLADL